MKKKQQKYKTVVGNILGDRNILFKEYILPRKVHTVSNVSAICHCEDKQIIKTMVFKSGVNFIIIAIPGNQNIDKLTLSKLLNQDIKMASAGQVVRATGYNIGAVAPFLNGRIEGTQLWADESLLNNDTLYMGSGDPSTLIIISATEFKRAFNGEYLKIT